MRWLHLFLTTVHYIVPLHLKHHPTVVSQNYVVTETYNKLELDRGFQHTLEWYGYADYAEQQLNHLQPHQLEFLTKCTILLLTHWNESFVAQQL